MNLEEQFAGRFRCPKCQQVGATTKRIATTGAGLSKLLRHRAQPVRDRVVQGVRLHRGVQPGSAGGETEPGLDPGRAVRRVKNECHAELWPRSGRPEEVTLGLPTP